MSTTSMFLIGMYTFDIVVSSVYDVQGHAQKKFKGVFLKIIQILFFFILTYTYIKTRQK